jgi:CheY-like chemotaxis protein
MRLLIADDDADTRATMGLLLERAGYSVQLAPDGAKALEMQREAPADVLITDLFMPEVDGLEAIERFREEFPGVKIVAMSGGGVRVRGETYLSTAAVAGAEVLLRKPFEIDALLQVLKGLQRAPGA